MRFETVHVDNLPGRDELDRFDLAVVIDVLRAFTTAPWILRQGASQLLLAPDVKTALQAKATYPQALLVKDGPPDARFDLPNAPGRIAQEDLSGQTIIQTTGNGTRGAHAVAAVADIVCSSFVTAAATARYSQRHRSILFLVTEGDEDVALADYLRELLSGEQPDPRPFLQRVLRSRAGVECAERGKDDRYPGVHPDDLTRSVDVDTFDYVLRVRPAGTLLAIEPIRLTLQ